MAEKEKEKEKEKEARHLITRIGKELAALKSCPNKDFLIKLLKQAASAFPELEQSESLKSSIKPLSDSLTRHGLLRHKDKDIKLLVGMCICEIIRVLAPNPDFSDTVFRDIFILLLSMFGELDDVASPYFSRRTKLLETVAKLQFCVLMLDTGCEDLVLKMFKSFFNVVREDHPQSLINSMSSIITRILEEKLKEVDSDPFNFEANTSQPLLDMILHNMIKERKGVASASFLLAVSVVQNCGEKLERYVCQFLTSCILNRDAATSVVKEFYHEIILEIFQIAPQMLLSVIPNLIHELLTDQVDVRIKALNLIKKLLALPGHRVVREYRHVFIELLNRFSDKSAEVRLAALSCAKALYLTNPSGGESLEICSAIQGRLLDHDDKVRAEAVRVMCDIARTSPNFISSDLISQASERLRDKKVSVRTITVQKLVELYQDYCTKCATGITFFSKHIEQIPCKILMLCYEKDCMEFRPQSIELVLADLFPASLSIEERTRHWIYMFSIFMPPHLKALKIILSQKRRLQDWLQDYLDLCNRTEVNGSGDVERKMVPLVVKMSACFPDPAKAKDYFQKLNELNDKGILSGLQQFLRKEITLDSQTTMDGYLKDLDNQNLSSEFFHLLSTKASFNIFSSKHVHYILDCLSSDEVEKHLKDYYVQLLLTIIGAFPSFLRGLEKQFQHLLVKKDIPFNEQLIEMLAREGSQMSINLSDIYPSLEKVCLEGTRAQSKLAVSAIAALAGTSELFVLSELCKTLVDSLRNGQNTPTVLQSLCCVARHSVSTFESQEKVITQYIVEEIFRQNDAHASKDLDLFVETSESCSSCKLKVFGLKALVWSFLPYKHTTLSRPINFLLEIIQKMLQKDAFPDGNSTCKCDESHIRLAAANSVLRLSRKWELHISPQIYRLTVLLAKDQSPLVRRSFLDKLHKLLMNHAVPSRYACAFSFAALDSLKDLRCDALKYLEEYIREYGKGAQINETMPMQGAANHPLYLVVFLIHVLAHDTHFPTPDCQDEDTYTQILSPLFVTLQTIVNANLVASSLTLNVSSYLRNILHAIKRAEDAVDTRMTPRLHLVAEVGVCILNSLNADLVPVPHTPGLILLPSSLFRSGPAKMREANVHSLNDYKFDANFMKKLVSSLKTEVVRSVSVGAQCGQQICQNSSRPSGTRHGKSNTKSGNLGDMLRNKMKGEFEGLCTRQKGSSVTSYQDVDTEGRLNQIISSPLHNEYPVENEHITGAHRNSDTKLSFSCGSETKRPLLTLKEATVSSQRDEDTITRSSHAEPSNLTRASDHMDHCSSKIIKWNREALVGKHIKLWSSLEKCYYSGVVDDFDSTNSVHQITFDSGVVDNLSLDSEKWEIDLDNLRSQYCDHGGESSSNSQRKCLGAFEYKSKPDNLPKNGDLCARKIPQDVRRDKRCQDAIDTSTSEVTDMNGNAVGRRTRRQRV